MPKKSAAKPVDPADEVQLQIRMTRALRDRLKLRAVKDSRDMSTLARLLIEQGLRQPRQPRAAANEARS